jgi:hypothetical protein
MISSASSPLCGARHLELSTDNYRTTAGIWIGKISLHNPTMNIIFEFRRIDASEIIVKKHYVEFRNLKEECARFGE